MSEFLEGISCLLPPEAMLLRRLEARLAAVMEGLGFMEVRLPMVIDPAGLGSDEGTAESKIKFAAPDGSIAALRADMTLQAARLSVRELASFERPLPIFYSGEVFRKARNKGASYLARQDMHMGAEVFSDSPSESCVMALTAAIDACKTVKSGLQLRIGDIALLDGLARTAGMDGRQLQSFKEALLSKDIYRASSALRALGGENRAAKTILELMPANDAKVATKLLDELVKDFSGTNLATKAQDASGLVGKAIVLSGGKFAVAFELGLIRPLSYYSGLVFEAYAEGVGVPVLGGGQYDGLMRAIGSKESGSGFAMDLGVMLRLMEEGAV